MTDGPVLPRPGSRWRHRASGEVVEVVRGDAQMGDLMVVVYVWPRTQACWVARLGEFMVLWRRVD